MDWLFVLFTEIFCPTAATCLPGGFFNHESFPGEGLMEEEDKMGPTTWGGGCSVRASALESQVLARADQPSKIPNTRSIAEGPDGVSTWLTYGGPQTSLTIRRLRKDHGTTPSRPHVDEAEEEKTIHAGGPFGWV
ncbi:hypothetical protein GW17_00040157 [Ensete ventricosum]|nr:hypothetical protein GW17_00040157 [Ensete ventricosum]